MLHELTSPQSKLARWLTPLITHYSISAKLGWSFGSILFLTVLVGAVSIFALLQINALVDDILMSHHRIRQDSTELLNTFRIARFHERNVALEIQTASITKVQATSYDLWLDSVEDMALMLAEFDKLQFTNATEKELLLQSLQGVKSSSHDYQNRTEIFFDGLSNSANSLASPTNTSPFDLDVAASALEENILFLKKNINSQHVKVLATFEAWCQFYITVILASVILSIALAGLLARILSHQIIGPVLALTHAADEIAKGKSGARAKILSQDEIGLAAKTFNTMANQREELLSHLEERVIQRTSQLETAAKVASEASAMRDLQRLLDSTTHLLVKRFSDIYHAQIFLINQQGVGDWAILRASTGEAGQKLLQRQHRLQVGSRSVVGQVTATGRYILARTLDKATVHRANDLLPLTTSELALPMKREGRVIGALDVQSQNPLAFDEDDVSVLQTLADQLTIAVENARLFQHLGANVEEAERLFQASSGITAASNQDDVLNILTNVAKQSGELDRFSVLFFEKFDADGHPIGATHKRSWSRVEGYVSPPQQDNHDLNFYIPPHERFNIISVINEIWRLMQREVFEVPDISSYASLDERLYQAFRAAGLQSFVVIPLKSDQHYLGVILLGQQIRGPLPAALTRTFRVLAQQASVALNRFALLNQLSGRVNELQQLRSTFLALSSSTELSSLFEQLAPRAATLVEADTALVYLYNQEQGVMELVALHGSNVADGWQEIKEEEGQGAAGTLIEQPKPFLIDNYTRWSHRWNNTAESKSTQTYFLNGYGAMAAVPLLWQDHLLGALVTLNRPNERRFNAAELRRLTLLADQASLTIENVRLLRETQHSLQQNSILYTSTQALMGASSEEELLIAIVSHLKDLAKDVVMVIRPTEDEPQELSIVAINHLELYISDGFDTINSGELFSLESRFLAPEELPNIKEATQSYSEFSLKGVQFNALMSVPIYASRRAKFYGAILLLRQEKKAFQADELTRTSTIGVQFGIAYDNIQLLSESQRAARQLTTATEVSRAASMQLEVDEVLTQAVDLIKERFHYYHVQVFLLDQTKMWAELRASTGEIGQQLLAKKHRLAVASRSVIGQVTSHGKPIVARSADIDPQSIHRHNELLTETKTELALSMKIGEQVIGALDVQSVDPTAFGNSTTISSSSEMDILQTLANQLAVAVQNARFFEASQQSLRDSQTLYEAGQAISEATSLEDILAALAEYVVPSDTSAISLLAIEMDEHTGKASHLRVEALQIIKPGETHVGELLRRRKVLENVHLGLIDIIEQTQGNPIPIHDVLNDSRIDLTSLKIFEKLGIRAAIIMPLTYKAPRVSQHKDIPSKHYVTEASERFILQLCFPQPRHISAAEIERIRTIATQVGTAIQNLYLLANLAKRSERLDASNLLASKLLEANKLNDLAQLATHEITNIMGVDQTRLLLFDLELGIAKQIAHVNIIADLNTRQEAVIPNTIQLSLASQPVIEWLEQHRRPLALSNLLSETVRLTIKPLFKSEEIVSILIVPLFVRDQIIGLIQMDMLYEQRNWDDIDISLGQTLSNLVAATIERTRLFEQIRITLEQSQTLYYASKAINEAKSAHEIAEVIATYVIGASDASVLLLALGTDNNQVIRTAHIKGVYFEFGNGLPHLFAPKKWRNRKISGSTLKVLSRLNPIRKPHIIENIAQATYLTKHEKRLFDLLNIKALMCVPIRLPSKSYGTILVIFNSCRFITENDQYRLEAIATQAATAMQNRDLLKKTQASLLESQLLYQAGTRINEAETLEGLLEAFSIVAEPIDPDQIVLMLFDEPVHEDEQALNLTIRASLNLRQELLPSAMKWRVQDLPLFKRSPVSVPIICEDIQKSERLSSDERHSLSQQWGLGMMLYLPLRLGNRYMGWVGFNAATPRTLQENNVRNLDTIAQQAAIALQSQQLLAEAQRRAWHEEQISHITARLHSTTEPEEIMRIGLQELNRTLKIKRAMTWVEPWQEE